MIGNVLWAWAWAWASWVFLWCVLVGTGCRSEVVTGKLQLVAEDHFDKGTFYKYGLLEEMSVVELNISNINILGSSKQMRIEGEYAAPSSTRKADATASDEERVFVVQSVSEATDSEEQGHQRKRSNELGARSILLVRIVYNGVASDYCDEACMQSNMWTAASGQTVSGVFEQATNGQITFPEDQGQIESVSLQGSLDSSRSCDYVTLAAAVDRELRNHGVNPSEFMHVAYHIPLSFTACTFGGVAFLGCQPYDCKLWVRQKFATNLAHELGHNLGMHHSTLDQDDNGQQENEYGDNSCIMGAAAKWRAISAPHRIQRGWINADQLLSYTNIVSGSRSLRIQALDLVGLNNIVQVVTIPRVDGGKYVISYRGTGHYDNTMPDSFKSTITVHHMPDETDDFEERTFLVQAVDIGNWVLLQGRIAVIFHSMTPTVADIEIQGYNAIFQPPPLPDTGFLATVECGALGWRPTYQDNSGKWVCGASEALGKCYQNVNLYTAIAVCEQVGARLCTPTELLSDATQGTGCNLDSKYIWTSESCPGGAKIAFGREPSASQTLSHPTVCRAATDTIASSRCCSDNHIETTTTTTTTSSVTVPLEQLSTPVSLSRCSDISPSCALSASFGQCNMPQYLEFLRINCRLSCGFCSPNDDVSSSVSTIGLTTSTPTTPEHTIQNDIKDDIAFNFEDLSSEQTEPGVLENQINFEDTSSSYSEESVVALTVAGIAVLSIAIGILLIRHKQLQQKPTGSTAEEAGSRKPQITISHFHQPNGSEIWIPATRRTVISSSGSQQELSTPDIELALFDKNHKLGMSPNKTFRSKITSSGHAYDLADKGSATSIVSCTINPSEYGQATPKHDYRDLKHDSLGVVISPAGSGELTYSSAEVGRSTPC